MGGEGKTSVRRLGHSAIGGRCRVAYAVCGQKKEGRRQMNLIFLCESRGVQ